MHDTTGKKNRKRRWTSWRNVFSHLGAGNRMRPAGRVLTNQHRAPTWLSLDALR